jgi:hypothetical protein
MNEFNQQAACRADLGEDRMAFWFWTMVNDRLGCVASFANSRSEPQEKMISLYSVLGKVRTTVGVASGCEADDGRTEEWG